jgi:predicted Zn-dependent protease
MVFPTFARADLEQAHYLRGVMHHLERAKQTLESGQLSAAMAHSRMVLHDQGLRVHIDFSEVPEGQKNDCERSIQYWNDTLGSGSLNLVDTAQAAEVQIVFNREVKLEGVQVGGYCSQTRSITVTSSGDATANYSATIQARYQLPGGKSLNEDCLTNIVTHEIGHVYGLNDCTDRGHLMSALNPSKPKSELDGDEMEALKQLRLTAFGIQRQIQAKSKGN